MKKRLHALRNEEGLTLVELLAVIVILAIIAVVGFVMIGKVIANSKTDTHIANATQMIASAKLYEATENGLPTGDVVTLDQLQDTGHIEDPILDPWDNDPITGSANLVTKATDGTYSVVLEGPNDGCTVTGEEAELIAKDDRDALCQ